MFTLLTAIISLSLTYFLPGLAVSYTLFPSQKSLSRGERLVLSFGLSPGIVTFLMFLSNTIFNSFEIIFIVSSLSLIIVCSFFLFWLQRKHGGKHVIDQDVIAPSSSLLPRPFMLLFVISVFLVLVLRFYQALNFPIVSWDSLTEFAYLGRLYFQTNRMPIISGATLGVQSSANYPPLVVLLYAWLYKMYGSVNELFIKSVSPLYSTLTALLTYMFSKMIYKSKAKAWASTFFLVTVPIFIFTAEDCLSDSPLMFYFASSLFFLYISIKDSRRKNRAMMASGLLGGLAAWTKYDGVFVLLIVFVLFIVVNFCLRKGMPKFTFSFRHLILFLVCFALLGAPWYIRNWSTVGNPVYPFLYKLFGGKNIDPWLMQNGFDAQFDQIKKMDGLDVSFRSILLTYFTVFFTYPPFEVTDMGPFLGAFILLGLFFFLKRHDNDDAFIITWSISYFLVWRLAFNTFLRYLVAILPALALLSGNGFCELYRLAANVNSTINSSTKKRIPLKIILRTVLFLVILGGTFFPTMLSSIRGYKTWAFVSPTIKMDEYMEMRLPGWWQAITYLNQETPVNAVILTYDHSIAYYVNRVCIFVDEPRIKEIHLTTDIIRLSSILKQLNITHFLDNRYYDIVDPLIKQSYFYDQLENRCLFDPVFNISQIIVYKIESH